MPHLGLKASTPSYQLAPDRAGPEPSHDEPEAFSLVPHQAFEREKRRQLSHHRRRRGIRHLAARWMGGDDSEVLTAEDEDPLDVRSKGLKPQYLQG